MKTTLDPHTDIVHVEMTLEESLRLPLAETGFLDMTVDEAEAMREWLESVNTPEVTGTGY